ncbi:hypothetical protein SAY86_017902 [Trapa natans]|uniref:DC1 domain-containing protein n=1 Tax=Trapa natans TaxID=22666 RepID=A0AAN7M2M5_TRANT|nr:hypothetical protein SAY86_017902 [Trapa natans]
MEVSRHFSHHHALRPFKIREANQGFKTCSGCERDLHVGPAYRCSKPNCDFFLHSSCFSLPPELHHGSHPNHPLILLFPPPYPDKDFICNACGETSSAFTYHCSACTYDLHVGCAHLPFSVNRKDGHPHPLNLRFPDLAPEADDEDAVGYLSCSVCYGSVTEQCWVYRCEKCDFSTHPDCVAAIDGSGGQTEGRRSDASEEDEEKGRGGGEEEDGGSVSDHLASLMAAQNELQLLRFQNQMAYQNAQFISSLGSSLAKLA